MLTAYVGDKQQDWEKYLPKLAYAIRSAQHNVTGFTPNFINFGRKVKLSGKAKQPVSEPLIFDRETHNPLLRSDALRQVYVDVVKRLQAAYIVAKSSITCAIVMSNSS